VWVSSLVPEICELPVSLESDVCSRMKRSMSVKLWWHMYKYAQRMAYSNNFRYILERLNISINETIFSKSVTNVFTMLLIIVDVNHRLSMDLSRWDWSMERRQRSISIYLSWSVCGGGTQIDLKAIRPWKDERSIWEVEKWLLAKMLSANKNDNLLSITKQIT